MNMAHCKIADFVEKRHRHYRGTVYSSEQSAAFLVLAEAVLLNGLPEEIRNEALGVTAEVEVEAVYQKAHERAVAEMTAHFENLVGPNEEEIEEGLRLFLDGEQVDVVREVLRYHDGDHTGGGPVG